ncbi:hypothetical protein FCV62_12210 [Vibrio kanaloae]|uniref:hypothetical protein n=1 Tax=Vibrio kanaloae TaxID=170673 RepID=UPI0010BE4C68|nr:hypothetical protein [Vibrio kanaloae]TKF78442.1 hypothetical protein FCV62_12210 [Vibrio kanaloae]
MSNNFEIKLAYISTVSPNINIERVASRVAKGGHDVPEKDILRRYERSLDNVGLFFDRATEKVLIDNSTNSNDLNLQLHVKDNKTLFVVDNDKITNWVSRALGKDRLNKIYDQVIDTDKAIFFDINYKWSKPDVRMIVSINGSSPANIDENILSKIIANDKFLSCYSMADIQSGKLDLSMANGVQPVPKIYDSQGSPVIEQASIQPLKLK